MDLIAPECPGEGWGRGRGRGLCISQKPVPKYGFPASKKQKQKLTELQKEVQEKMKKGEKKKSNEIEAITGATISSKAVGRLLDKSMAGWRPLIEAYEKKE